MSASSILTTNAPVVTVRMAVDRRVTEFLDARTTLDRLTAELEQSRMALADAEATAKSTRRAAERVQDSADEARHTAETAAALYLRAARGPAASVTPLDAMTGDGDLLAGLAGAERLSALTGDAAELMAEAADRGDEADELEALADDAWRDFDAIPVSKLARAVASAEVQRSTADSRFAELRAAVASSEMSEIVNLPGDSGQLSDQGWSLPVTGRISDGFGPRPNAPIAGVSEFHRGTDLATRCGSPVYAATAGVVVEAGPNGTYGNWILIEHGSGIATGYAHLADGGVLVKPGDTVDAGGLVGVVGSTGASTGCHLHFEVRIDGAATDAVPFMALRGIRLG